MQCIKKSKKDEIMGRDEGRKDLDLRYVSDLDDVIEAFKSCAGVDELVFSRVVPKALAADSKRVGDIYTVAEIEASLAFWIPQECLELACDNALIEAIVARLHYYLLTTGQEDVGAKVERLLRIGFTLLTVTLTQHANLDACERGKDTGDVKIAASSKEYNSALSLQKILNTWLVTGVIETVLTVTLPYESAVLYNERGVFLHALSCFIAWCRIHVDAVEPNTRARVESCWRQALLHHIVCAESESLDSAKEKLAILTALLERAFSCSSSALLWIQVVEDCNQWLVSVLHTRLHSFYTHFGQWFESNTPCMYKVQDFAARLYLLLYYHQSQEGRLGKLSHNTLALFLMRVAVSNHVEREVRDRVAQMLCVYLQAFQGNNQDTPEYLVFCLYAMCFQWLRDKQRMQLAKSTLALGKLAIMFWGDARLKSAVEAFRGHSRLYPEHALVGCWLALLCYALDKEYELVSVTAYVRFFEQYQSLFVDEIPKLQQMFLACWHKVSIEKKKLLLELEAPLSVKDMVVYLKRTSVGGRLKPQALLYVMYAFASACEHGLQHTISALLEFTANDNFAQSLAANDELSKFVFVNYKKEASCFLLLVLHAGKKDAHSFTLQCSVPQGYEMHIFFKHMHPCLRSWLKNIQKENAERMLFHALVSECSSFHKDMQDLFDALVISDAMPHSKFFPLLQAWMLYSEFGGADRVLGVQTCGYYQQRVMINLLRLVMLDSKNQGECEHGFLYQACAVQFVKLLSCTEHTSLVVSSDLFAWAMTVTCPKGVGDVGLFAATQYKGNGKCKRAGVVD